MATNKQRASIRRAIERVLQVHFTPDKLEAFIEQLKAEEGVGKAATFYMQLMEYTVPKLNRVEHVHEGAAMTIEHVVKDISSSSGSSLPVIDQQAQDAQMADADLQQISHEPADVLSPVPEGQLANQGADASPEPVPAGGKGAAGRRKK